MEKWIILGMCIGQFDGFNSTNLLHNDWNLPFRNEDRQKALIFLNSWFILHYSFQNPFVKWKCNGIDYKMFHSMNSWPSVLLFKYARISAHQVFIKFMFIWILPFHLAVCSLKSGILCFFSLFHSVHHLCQSLLSSIPIAHGLRFVC